MDKTDPFYYEENSEIKRCIDLAEKTAAQARERYEAGNFNGAVNALYGVGAASGWALELSLRVTSKVDKAKKMLRAAQRAA